MHQISALEMRVPGLFPLLPHGLGRHRTTAMEGHVIVESYLRLLYRCPRPLSVGQKLVVVWISVPNCRGCLILQLHPPLDRLLYVRFQKFALAACHQSPFCSGGIGFCFNYWPSSAAPASSTAV